MTGLGSERLAGSLITRDRTTPGAGASWAREELDYVDELCRVAEDAGAHDNYTTQVELLAARARLRARQGAQAEAESLAREAVTTVDAGEQAVTFMAIHWALGDVLRLVGRTNEAVDEWRQLLAGADQMGNHLYGGGSKRRSPSSRQEAMRRGLGVSGR